MVLQIHGGQPGFEEAAVMEVWVGWGGDISLKYNFISGDYKWTRVQVLGGSKGDRALSHCVNGVTWSFVLNEVTCGQDQRVRNVSGLYGACLSLHTLS